MLKSKIFGFSLMLICTFGYTDYVLSDNKLRDPTKPLNFSSKASHKAKLKLQSIIIGDNKREAIIDGRRVQEKQTISGATILSIRSQTVVYSHLGKTHTLRLRKTNIGKILSKASSNK